MNIGIGEKFKMNGRTWYVVDVRENKYICRDKQGFKTELTREQIKTYFN